MYTAAFKAEGNKQCQENGFVKDRQVIPVIGKCRHHFNLTIQKASAVKTGTIN